MSQEKRMKGGNVIKEDSQIILHVLKGYEGLPSVDPDTARLLLYIKMENLTQVQVKVCRYAVIPSLLPMLSIDGTNYTHTEVIMSYLEMLSEHTLDSKYDTINRGRIWAYKEMTKTHLDDSITLNSWATEGNIIIATTYYTKGLKFPTNILFSRNLRKLMEKKMNKMGKMGVEDEQRSSYAKSKVCLQDLETLLNKKPYFFGNTPSTLDIHVCSLLSHVLTVEYPDTKLKNIILSEAPTLADTANKFIADYGDGNPETVIDKSSENGPDRAPIALIAFAGFIAASTMMMYAIYNGIVKVK